MTNLNRGSIGAGLALITSTVVAWRAANHPAKFLGEMALVGEAKFAGDLSEGFVCEHKRAAAHSNAQLTNVIVRGAVVRGAKLTFECAHRQAARFSEIEIRDTVAIVLANEPDGRAHGRASRRSHFLFAERSCHSRGPDDPPLGIVQGNFRCYTPASRVIEASDKFDPGKDTLALEDTFVVDPILVGHQLPAKIVIGAANNFGAIRQAEVEQKRNIHPLVVPGFVFHPQRNVFQIIE